MRYVYLIQSESSAGQRYIGVTSDLKQRLTEHNEGIFAVKHRVRVPHFDDTDREQRHRMRPFRDLGERRLI